MSAWPLVALGDIFQIARGGSPRPIEDYVTKEPDGVNWITIGDASEGSKYITRTKKRIRTEGAKRSRLVHSGDFLLTNSMSFGRPYIMRTSGCIHDGWLVLSRRRDFINQDFFFHLLGSKAVYAEFARLAAGATVKNLNIELVKGVHIPLPPLLEQRRIAEILDQAEALRAKRRAALGQLDTLTQAIFLDLFGDPATNRKGWPETQLGELLADAEVFVDGDWVESKDQDPSGQVRLVQLADVGDGAYIDKSARFMNGQAAFRLKCTFLKVGDVLVARMPDPLGRACIFPGDSKDSVTVVDVCIIRPASTGPDSTWLVGCINSAGFRRLIARHATGTTRQRISRGNLSRLPIVVPPLDRQREFARRVAAVEKLQSVHRASLAELDALFSSLQHRAFRGEL